MNTAWKNIELHKNNDNTLAKFWRFHSLHEGFTHTLDVSAKIRFFFVSALFVADLMNTPSMHI